MSGFYSNIEKQTLKNSYFRKVLFTGIHSQLVVMNIKPGEEIGEEVHSDVDQFFRIERGLGKIIVEDTSYIVKDGDAVIVPSGSRHNVINTSDKQELKLYTIYSPPNHPDKTVHKTKDEADETERKHH